MSLTGTTDHIVPCVLLMRSDPLFLSMLFFTLLFIISLTALVQLKNSLGCCRYMKSGCLQHGKQPPMPVLLSDHLFGSTKISVLQLPLIRVHRGHLMKSSVFCHCSAEKCKMRSWGRSLGQSTAGGLRWVAPALQPCFHSPSKYAWSL